MNDQRFFDLAMKVIARQSSDAERAELDALFARAPELRAEFARLEADVRVANDALPLVDATKATAGELPGYARGRLQTKVRQTIGSPTVGKERDRSLTWGWRLVLGLAAPAVAVVVLLVVLPTYRASNAPLIQLALLDTAGGTRGTETNDVALLQATSKGTPVRNFSSASELEAWEKDWPMGSGRPAAKIIYDRAAGEVRVSGHSKGKPFKTTFPVEKELAATLEQVHAYIRQQMKR